MEGVDVLMVLAFDTTAFFVALLTGSALTAVIGLIGQRLAARGKDRATDAHTLQKYLEDDNRRLRSELQAMTEDVFVVRTKALDLTDKAARATRIALALKRENARLRARCGS